MIDLRSTRKLEEAYGSKIDNILTTALENAISDFVEWAATYNRKVHFNTWDQSELTLKLECNRAEFDKFKERFRTCYLDALARHLELVTSERIELGPVTHANRLGNNNAYPIYVLTKTRKILVGYLHSNQDTSPTVHYIFVQNTKKERMYRKTINLICMY